MFLLIIGQFESIVCCFKNYVYIPSIPTIKKSLKNIVIIFKGQLLMIYYFTLVRFVTFFSLYDNYAIKYLLCSAP